ncbi:hypothetical protein [Polyangium aurulentum]|uniref:hypothetical protein n=1 Tax=Polyangium aurulentum TaxID=2567896 RepID=UPI0010AE41D2|nr:hypothetical protein [Polyangium aurulentum]UQA60704.1 hypothetical protein E8A73_009580 [Polyangium aurulentum]
MQVVTAGSIVEGIGGLTAVVLSILGLGGMRPLSLIPIAVIAVGAALLFGGGALAARYSKFVAYVSDRTEAAEFGGGVGSEFLVGASGVVLGVLALLGIAPIVLSAVAVIGFGAGLLLSTGATSAVNAISDITPMPYDRHIRYAREAVQGAVGVQALVGIASAILGILALLAISPVTLLLVALLCLGGGVLIAASAVSSRLLVSLRHYHHR